MSRNSLSRRDFIRLSCCSATGAALATGLGRFGLVNAFAACTPSPGYKALVCIFLFGGNDGNNMLIPVSTQGFADYSNARTGLALAQGTLVPINPGTNPQPYSAFAMHPAMAPLQPLFNNGRLAFVSNVGTLVKPIKQQSDYINHLVQVPSALFSHSDQQNQWQTSVGNSNSASGWAGRTADATQCFNPAAKLPTIISVAGGNIFATGLLTRPAIVSPGQTSAFANLDTTRSTAMQHLLSFDSGVSLVQAASAVTGFAFTDSNNLAAALATGTPLATQFPATSIGNQLKQVAQIMQVRSALQINRQIFFCSMGGYDTHSNQLIDQNNLLTQLSAGMSAFFNATLELGVGSQVTTFTLSEFGRTLQLSASGSTPGSDHAWGSHQMVMGGAVQGADIYGTYPTLVIGGPNDTNISSSARGRWIPSTSLDQYAATLASWFGVSPTDLLTVFPDLNNFQPNLKLAFMG